MEYTTSEVFRHQTTFSHVTTRNETQKKLLQACSDRFTQNYPLSAWAPPSVQVQVHLAVPTNTRCTQKSLFARASDKPSVKGPRVQGDPVAHHDDPVFSDKIAREATRSTTLLTCWSFSRRRRQRQKRSLKQEKRLCSMIVSSMTTKPLQLTMSRWNRWYSCLAILRAPWASSTHCAMHARCTWRTKLVYMYTY